MLAYLSNLIIAIEEIKIAFKMITIFHSINEIYVSLKTRLQLL